jgi:hypothetical protein
MRDQIMAAIRESPGSTDRELTDRLVGEGAPQQKINSACRGLAGAGLIVRRTRPDGRLGNFAVSKSGKTARPDVAGRRSTPGRAGPSFPLPTTIQARPHDSVHQITATTSFFWRAGGELGIDDAGVPIFPTYPASPGIYRLRFTAQREVYVGETENLRRRFRNYRRPGATQYTSLWVRDRLVQALRDRELVLIEFSSSVSLELQGATGDADLSRKNIRLLMESIAILCEQREGWVVLNRSA